MDLSKPARSVVPSLAADVLVVLAGTTLPLTGRQVHRLVPGASWSGVRKVLGHLEASGLVHLTEAGRAHLYELNREHVAAEAALALLDLRGKLFARIREALDAWSTPPLRAAVFGSAARGDGDLDSDVDVFVVRPEAVAADDADWAHDVTALSLAIRRWSGNTGSVIQASTDEVADMIARGEPIVADLARDHVPLRGVSVLDVASGRT